MKGVIKEEGENEKHGIRVQGKEKKIENILNTLLPFIKTFISDTNLSTSTCAVLYVMARISSLHSLLTDV